MRGIADLECSQHYLERTRLKGAFVCDIFDRELEIHGAESPVLSLSGAFAKRVWLCGISQDRALKSASPLAVKIKRLLANSNCHGLGYFVALGQTCVENILEGVYMTAGQLGELLRDQVEDEQNHVAITASLDEAVAKLHFPILVYITGEHSLVLLGENQILNDYIVFQKGGYEEAPVGIFDLQKVIDARKDCTHLRERKDLLCAGVPKMTVA
ncbi:MAG TPA: hypothetical protein VIT68_04970 [Candidatus Gracilibacteria bacterium]